MDIEALADKVSAAMNDYVSRGFATISKRLTDLQTKIDTLPVPKDGTDGKDGEPGRDADPEVIALMVQNAVAAIEVPLGKDGRDGDHGIDGPPGKDGKDGISVDPETIRSMIDEAVAKTVSGIAIPKDGADGINGKDGVSVDIDFLLSMVDESVAKAVAAMPVPKDGTDGANGLPGRDGQDARDGRDGEPGRDAAQIDILPAIDQTRSYQRGTYASHDGGLIRARRSTDPVTAGLVEAGWEVIVPGVKEVGIEQGEDLRSFAIGVQLTGDKAYVRKFVLPTIMYVGLYKAGTDYVPGDVVTWDGSAWHCQEATKDEPGNGKTWKLMVKRGSAGKDGASVKGEEGKAGKNGRDLTQLMPDGTKY